VGDDPAEAGEDVFFDFFIFSGFDVGGGGGGGSSSGSGNGVVVALEDDGEENLVRVRSGVALEPCYVFLRGGEGAVGQVGECV